MFITVDTCASEFSSNTPYHYSTYERPAYNIDNDGNIIKNINLNELKDSDYKLDLKLAADVMQLESVVVTGVGMEQET